MFLPAVGERSAGDGQESSHDESPDITTDDDMDDDGEAILAEALEQVHVTKQPSSSSGNALMPESTNIVSAMAHFQHVSSQRSRAMGR